MQKRRQRASPWIGIGRKAKHESSKSTPKKPRIILARFFFFFIVLSLINLKLFKKKKTPPLLSSGYLVSVDAYMNLQLASTQEFIDGKLAGDLGEVLIRCNNVLYVRGAPDEAGGGGGGGGGGGAS